MSKDCKNIVIAIDGHSSTGKSTVAKLLAAMFELAYIDTGAMYRVVTLFAMRRGLYANGKVEEQPLKALLPEIKITFRYNPETGKADAYLNDENVEQEIRGIAVSGAVSYIAAIGFVRSFLVEQQREMGKSGGVILDGRDIGSVVFPNADIKFFMTASPKVRAQRRFDELTAKGDKVSFEEVEKNILERDFIDQNRKESPLIQTPDALLIDNSEMNLEDELAEMKQIIERYCSQSH